MSAEHRADLPRINILTRTGNRRASFERLASSIAKQGIAELAHIVSVDMLECDYVKHAAAVVVRVKRSPKRFYSHCPYNMYLAKLLARVEKGWVMIVDDDARFLYSDYLHRVQAFLQGADDNTVILQPVLTNTDFVRLPRFEEAAPFGWRVDMANLVFHASWKDKLRFDDQCGGDKRMFRQMFDAGARVTLMDIEPGIWANSGGARAGLDYGDITIEAWLVFLAVAGVLVVGGIFAESL